MLVWGLFRDGVPDDRLEAFVRVLLAAALVAPAVVLLLFRQACVEVLELPARLRALPRTAAGSAAELGRLLRERREQRGRTRRAWRLLVLGHSTRELLTPYAPLLALLSPPFLVAAAVAVAAAALEAAAALVVLVAAA